MNKGPGPVHLPSRKVLEQLAKSNLGIKNYAKATPISAVQPATITQMIRTPKR